MLAPVGSNDQGRGAGRLGTGMHGLPPAPPLKVPSGFAGFVQFSEAKRVAGAKSLGRSPPERNSGETGKNLPTIAHGGADDLVEGLIQSVVRLIWRARAEVLYRFSNRIQPTIKVDHAEQGRSG